MGSPWLATGPYSARAKPRPPGRFLDTSQTSGIPYLTKNLENLRGNWMFEMLVFLLLFFLSNMVSRRSGRYLETFLEPVAPLSSSMGPWRATATPFSPKIIDFLTFQTRYICIVRRSHLRNLLCGHNKSVGSQQKDVCGYNKSVGMPEICTVDTQVCILKIDYPSWVNKIS